MKVIGLTGSIGSGKSTVSNLLIEKGFKIIDADKIAKEILNKGTDAFFEVIQFFGEEILDENKDIDRKKLASIVFSDDEKLRKLNAITHPKIKKAIKDKIDYYREKNIDKIFLDAPLLIEANLTYMVDFVLLIICNYDIQVKRIMNRDNITKEEAKQRIKAQMSVEEKKKYADYIIDNSYTIDKLKDDVEMFLAYLEGV
ncbi:dephospho-CoA kinase [Alkalithermobacter thermoalcaliphilus JW-YL-7 = DSM 7308]|uniref:Dephospho-CoA kinase n=1 Tax=Alkalithermobacter thermoalcaliphilus JW-YL-7 = DSM 7308 TaxID=1121328 RepID=A0A150FT21_CLOPD|nr:Dephospho-CoA kinase [[Clostridium] paradoxum JW-YL-7 = DSM 7308]SHK43756.1 dephospho-CoA kinase [[Clostridium] paradoxum JW-YL-7 = DSM 7308]